MCAPWPRALSEARTAWVEHVKADADDDQEARGAHPRHVREPQSEAAVQHEVGEPDDDDGGDDVDDGDLHGHDHAPHHPRLAPEEVGDDDELPVPRPERMDRSIGEGDRKGQEKGTEILAPLDGVHVEGHLGVGAALEVHQQVGQPLERTGALLDDLDLDRRGDRRGGVSLGECERCSEQACQELHAQQAQQRDRTAAAASAGPITHRTLSLAGERYGLGMAGSPA